MTAAVRVLSQSARLGIDDFRSVYTRKSWLAGWLLRMLAQVAFFGSIGLLIGIRAEIGHLLAGNAVVLVCLEATIVVISVSVERFQGTLPLFAASPASPLLVYLGRGLHWMATGLATSVVTLTLLPPLFGLPLSPLRVLACLPVLVVIAVSSDCYGSFLASLVARFPQFNWLALNVGYLAVMTVAGVNVPVDFWPGRSRRWPTCCRSPTVCWPSACCWTAAASPPPLPRSAPSSWSRSAGWPRAGCPTGASSAGPG